MKLTHSCIITDNVKKLGDFYQKVLGVEVQFYGENYAECVAGEGTLAIFDLAEHDSMAPGSAKAGSNNSIILEFHVEDVDAEYTRLQKMDISWIKEPTI